MNINLGKLLKSLPRKQVARFILNLAAEVLERIDSDTSGIDDEAARAARAAAESMREVASNDDLVSAAGDQLPKTKIMQDSADFEGSDSES